MKLKDLFSISTLVILSCLLAGNASAMSAEKKAGITKRIAPVGIVCVEGDSQCAVASAAPAGGAPRSGEEIYGANCVACHGTGAAGAPKFGDKAAWAPHIAKGKDTLHKHALEGFQGMPAKGLCSNCSDTEIFATVDYMMSKSK